MEMTHKPGNLSCLEVCEMLSDLMDVRSGEIPHPDGTRISEPGMRPALELHLAACAACREEMRVLEEVGAAFAEYAVSEPSAQHFADYGAKARARMARETQAKIVPPKPNLFRRVFANRWMPFAASGLIAAGVAFAVMPRTTQGPAAGPDVVAEVDSPAPIEKSYPRIEAKDLRGETPLNVLIPNTSPTGVQYVAQPFMHNPSEPTRLGRLKQEEGRAGYLIFEERMPDSQRPLLGAQLKTTRDEDRLVNEGALGLMIYKVEPGSPAHRMGLKRDDYIVSINDMPVNNGSAEDAVNFLSGVKQLGTGAPITIHVVRMGRYGPIYIKPLTGELGKYE